MSVKQIFPAPLLFWLIAYMVVVIGCNRQSAPNTAVVKKAIKPIEKYYGNWLCSNLIDSIKANRTQKAILNSLHLPYAYEFQFDDSFNDSVLIYNGFEQYFLPVAIRNDSVIIENAVKGNPMILAFDSISGTIKMMIAGHDYPLPLVYYKADEKYIQPNGRFKESFTAAFNDASIAGSYTVISNNKLRGNQVIFNTNGSVSGLSDGYLYRCCIGGDCLETTSEPANTFTLINNTPPDETWSWQFDNSGEQLALKKLKASVEGKTSKKAPEELLLLVRNKSN